MIKQSYDVLNKITLIGRIVRKCSCYQSKDIEHKTYIFTILEKYVSKKVFLERQVYNIWYVTAHNSILSSIG